MEGEIYVNTKNIFIVKSQLDLDGLDIIAYPHAAMAFKVLLPSFREENRRVVKAYATVDMIKKYCNSCGCITRIN